MGALPRLEPRASARCCGRRSSTSSAPLRAFIPVAWRNDWLLQDLLQVAVYVQIGVLVLPFLNRWPKDESRSIGDRVPRAVAISGPYYVILYYVATNILFYSDTRFAYGLIPMFAVALAARGSRTRGSGGRSPR